MPIVKLPGGQLRDEIRLPLYDTVQIDSLESPVAVRTFFSNIQGKPRSWTNLRQPNLLETAVSYRIQGMAIDCDNVYGNLSQALALIMEYSSLRLHVGEKDYWEGPMRFAAGRVKSTAAIAATTQTAPGVAVVDARINQHFGDEAIQGVMFPGDHFVDINPLQSFFVEWQCSQGSAPFVMNATEIAASTPAATQKLLFMFSLKGLMRRPVQ